MKRQSKTTALVGWLVAMLAVGALILGLVAQGRAQEGEEQTPLVQYPDFPPTPTIGAAPSVPPALSAAPLYQSGFAEEADFAGWQIADLEPSLPGTSSRWGVRDGRLAQLTTDPVGNPDSRPTIAVAGDATWQDVVVSVNVYDLYNGVAGLVARRNGDNYYRFYTLVDYYEDKPKMALEKVVDGVVTRLAVVEAPGHQERTWHSLTLSVIGGQISAAFDGRTILSADDVAPLPGGQAGVYSRAFGGILFDDFVVSQP